MRFLAMAQLVSLFAAWCAVQAESSPPTAAEILARVKSKASEMALAAQAPQIRFQRETLLEQLSPRGEIKESTKREYDVIQFAGIPFAKIVKLDGRPLSGREQQREQEKERRFRRDLGDQRSAKESIKSPWLNDELLGRFNFVVEGSTNIEGRAAWVLGFSPRQPPAPIRSMGDRLINRLRGRLAVDCEDSEVSWMALQLAEKVSFGGGILGAVERFDYQMGRKRLDRGVWVNLQSTAWVEFRKLFSTTRHRSIEECSHFEIVPLDQRLAEPPEY